MTSTDVDFVTNYSVKNPEKIQEESDSNLPDESGENNKNNDPVVDAKMEELETESIAKKDSLFKLSGVDFVAEGKYVFGCPEENCWELPFKPLNLQPTNSPELKDRKPEDKTVENETGDGLQQSPKDDARPEPEVAVDGAEVEKPVVRKQFKNFKLNERILSQISNGRSSPYEKGSGVDPRPLQSQFRPKQLLFNGVGAGRFYTLTFCRDENNENLRDSKSDDFDLNNRFKNNYVPEENPSIQNNTDIDMPVDQVPVPEAELGNPVADDEFRTRSASKVLEDLQGRLKVYKTHSDLTVDEPLAALDPCKAGACQTPNTSSTTSDIDVQVEDEIKTVEPISSASSADQVTSLKQAPPDAVTSSEEIKARQTAVIVIEDTIEREMNSKDLDESMPSELSLTLDLSTSGLDGKNSSETDQSYNSPITSIPLTQNLLMGTKKSPEAKQKLRRNRTPSKRGTMDSWDDANSVAIDISHSFVSIDLSRTDELPDDVTETCGEPSGLRRSKRIQEAQKMGVHFTDSKKNPSRMLRMKRRIKNICERVKHNVIRKK